MTQAEETLKTVTTENSSKVNQANGKVGILSVTIMDNTTGGIVIKVIMLISKKLEKKMRFPIVHVSLLSSTILRTFFSLYKSNHPEIHQPLEYWQTILGELLCWELFDLENAVDIR